jgi:hypothetical protein
MKIFSIKYEIKKNGILVSDPDPNPDGIEDVIQAWGPDLSFRIWTLSYIICQNFCNIAHMYLNKKKNKVGQNLSYTRVHQDLDMIRIRTKNHSGPQTKK